ncbi:PorV/PorQ family protein [candidate division WOR-3 bacterium]|nr:PorV/PorQ family protein [candidate division WOR-3 bacterium]
MKRIIRFFLLGLFLTGLAYGEGVGGSSGELLNFGAGARVMGMGRAGTGLSDDASAPYYNPAGLYQINPQEILFMHTMLFMGISYDYLSYIHPTERFGSFGISFVQVRTHGIEDRDVTNVRIGSFDESEMVAILTYAKNIGSLVSLGANYKVVYHTISHWSSLGQGLDFSTLILPNKPLSVGLMFKNIVAPKLTLDTEEDVYPFIMRGGLSYKTLSDKLTVCTDMSWSKYRGILLFGGMEYCAHRYATLRLGMDYNYLTLGVGFNIPLPQYTIKVDYAYQHHYAAGGLVSPTQNFSISVDFGGFRAKLHPERPVFSPAAYGGENILWLQKEVSTREKIRKWQILINNSWGEVIRIYKAWGDIPARLYWDGRDETGNIVQDGTYYYRIIVTDETGRSYSSEGKLATVKTKGPEGRVLFEEQEDTLEAIPDTLIQFEETEKKDVEEKSEEEKEQ